MKNNSSKEKQTAYEKIRDIIISRLEKAKKAAEDGEGEAFHWVRPWSGSGLALNVSYNTEEAYQGINQVLLSLATNGADEWLTFNAIKKFHEKDESVKLRKGAKGQSIVYFDKYIPKDKDGEPLERDDEGNPIPRFFAKTYYVFSVEDVEGLARRTDKVKHYIHDEALEINRLESILAYYYKSVGLELEIVDGGNKAYFSPKENLIRVPDKSNFKNVASYAHTIAHETIHSSGEALGRNIRNSFGSKAYSAEELVADIGADFLINRLHIMSDEADDKELHNSIAYISGWLKALRSDDDKLNICKAATDAQKATDYIFEKAYQQMKEDMQTSNEVLMNFENGTKLYIQFKGNGIYQFVFCDSDGELIESDIRDDCKDAYDVARKVLAEYNLEVEDGWIHPEPYFEGLNLICNKDMGKER